MATIEQPIATRMSQRIRGARTENLAGRDGLAACLAVAGRKQGKPERPDPTEKAADPKAGGVRVLSSDDATVRTRLVGVGGAATRTGRLNSRLQMLSEHQEQLAEGVEMFVFI
jgi:hypothetical protein